METKKDWNNLTEEDRQAIMRIADSLFIPPQYVAEMWEQGMIDY